MIKKRQMQIVLLCEDSQQAVFARHYLHLRGFSRKKIRPLIAPNGAGAGEQFVRKNFAGQVKAYRKKSSHGHGGLALVAIIDADKSSVQNRLQQLDHELPSKRHPGEKIAIIVPKRNIETWIHFARGKQVDETTSYRKLERESDCKEDVKHLVEEICPKGLPKDAPSSLITACEELKRIL